MGDLEFYTLDAPVGSGKTEAAIRHMLNEKPKVPIFGSGGGSNFIYVAPTVRLLEAVRTRLERLASVSYSDVPRLVVSVTSEQTLANVGGELKYQAQGDAARNAISFLNAIEGTVGALVFLTTANFQAILPRIKRPHEWVVFVDELVEAVEFLSYPLGSNPERSESILGELSLELEGDELGPSSLCSKLAEGKDIGHEYLGSLELSKRLANQSLRVERIPGQANGADGNPRCWFTCEPKPAYFQQFKHAVFASARMQDTLLYKLWAHRHGVTFSPIDTPEFNDLHDTHVHQGPLLKFHWLFDEHEHASAYNLRRSRETLLPHGRKGQQVIDACVQAVDGFFRRGLYALQVNNWWRREAPRRAKRIPVKAEGLDEYRGLTDVALLAVTNPDKVMESWVRDRLDVSRDEANALFRLHTMYQGLGRIALRDRENTKPMRVVVLSRSDAKYLSGLFHGSKLGGKVGDIPAFTGGKTGRPKASRRLSDDPEYQRLVKDIKKYRLQVSRATTEDARVGAEGRVQTAVEGIDALKRGDF
jgi:hypothetical protein